MQIPFGNLKKQYHFIKPEIDEALARVLESGWFILGKEVDRFEKSFAEYCGATYCIGVGNGMEAIQIALMACGVGRGNEVITTPLSAVATSLAISHVGAVPVYVDIDPTSYNIRADTIDRAVTSKTKAIVPVHLYGRMADMEKIFEIAQKHKFFLIEDVAQAHGAIYGGKRSGTYGNFGAFSFYPSKNLGAYGDAGALITDDEELAKIARAMRDYGQTRRYEHAYFGMNSRLDEKEAAILSVKLKYLDTWNARRREIAKLYSSLLSGLPVELPEIPEDKSHAWHLYVIRTPRRDDLKKYLETKGISTQLHYPKTIYQQKVYKHLPYRGEGKIAEKVVREILSLPLYPELTDNEVAYVAEKIKEFFSNG